MRQAALVLCSGQRGRPSLAWDISDPSDMTWTNEISINNGPWSLIETYYLRPIS